MSDKYTVEIKHFDCATRIGIKVSRGGNSIAFSIVSNGDKLSQQLERWIDEDNVIITPEPFTAVVHGTLQHMTTHE